MPIFVKNYIFSVLVFQQKLMGIHQSYCTFLKPFTILQFTLLPYWIISESEVFSNSTLKIEGSEGERNTQDDIIMWVWILNKLDIHTKQVLNRIRTSGLKLKKDKCVFCSIGTNVFETHNIRKGDFYRFRESQGNQRHDFPQI